MCCVIKASGYTSGDDALDDRETEEEMAKSMQERKHGTAQVGCAGSEGLRKVGISGRWRHALVGCVVASN